jgi:hypothetical protein
MVMISKVSTNFLDGDKPLNHISWLEGVVLTTPFQAAPQWTLE